jgi:hypothetical protein
MLVALILLTAFHGAPDPPQNVELLFETVEAPSIARLDDGRVTFSQRATVPAGDSFHYEYTDPRDGRVYRVSLQLSPLAGGGVGMKLAWRDKESGEARVEDTDLGVDGRMALALHPLAEGDGELFLRVVPRLVEAR